MSTASATTKPSSGSQSGAAKSNHGAVREPFLAKLEGVGVIVRFNQDWALKCAREKNYAPFVRLFEDNKMPEAQQDVIDFSSAPESSRDALQLHTIKLYVTAISELARAGRELYQVYWMSLAVPVQTLIASSKGFEKIKDSLDIQKLKDLVEATFNNPFNAAPGSDDAIEKAQSTYHMCAQQDRENLSQYYKRFLQVVRHLVATLPKEMAPTEGMKVTRFLPSLNHRDGVYYSELKRSAALDGDNAHYPVSLEDALVKGAKYLLEHYSGAKPAATGLGNNGASATVYSAEKTEKDEKKPATIPPGPIKPKRDLSKIQCFNCKLFGHYKSDCKAKSVDSLLLGECGVCAEWTEGDDDTDFDTREPATETVMVKGDSCAEISIVGEGFPITNLRECEPLTVRGVTGSTQVSLVGEFGPLRDVYYHPDIPVNILALGEIEQVADVVYTQGVSFKATFHDGFGEMVFKKRRDKTYICEYKVKTVLSTAVVEFDTNDSVSTREKTYSKDELERARGVRELKRNLAGVSNKDLVEFITNGVSLNCPFTPADVRRAEAIYGPDIGCLKGKMTSPGPARPLVVNVDHGEQRRQELHTDIFEVSGVRFALTVMVPMNYTFATYLPGKTTEELIEAMSGLVRLITSKGFEISKMVVDPEGGLAALRDVMPFEVMVVAPGTHVPRPERKGRTVKERMRVVFNSLAYRLAVRFVKYLVFFVVTRLNMIPHASDGSRICPRERFTGKKVVYNKDLQLAFGDCVQVFSKPTQLNSMEERCCAAIALYPSNNEQGSWKFFKFDTGTIVTSDKWKKVPIQDVQIKALNDMADEDVADLGRGKRAKESMTRARKGAALVPLERMIVNPHMQIAVTEPADGTVIGRAVPPVVAGPEPPLMPMEDPPMQEESPHGVGLADTALVDQSEPPPLIDDPDSDDEEEEEREAPAPERVLGSRWTAEGTRMSSRQAERRGVFKLSVTQAIDKYGDLAERATLDEFSQMKVKRVMDLVHYADLTPEQRKRIIHSSLFLKEKYNEDGDLERIKARLVGRGDEMDRELYGSGASPTVATEAVAIMLAQSAAYNEVRFFVDIGTAFLEAPMDDDDVYVYVGKSLVKYMIKAIPEAERYIDAKGRVLVKLLKALYGCIQSSRLWYEHIRDILLSGGFRANDYDSCVFHKGTIGDQCTVALHVDDLFVSASTRERGEELLSLLKANLQEVKVKEGKVNSYLGMRIVETDTHLETDMGAYVRDCVEWSGVNGTAKTPADGHLFEVQENGVRLSPEAQERYHTGTAKLLYLAKRCRPDILTAISFLCARVTSATPEDELKLNRVFRYLSGTEGQVMKYPKGAKTMELFAFIDAGYGVHHTGESRSGLVITVNGTPVLCKSMRQHIVTKSSTEAELVALSDGLTEVLWAREFIICAGHELPATKIGEDNKSVLTMLEARRFGTARTKHISVRYFFICDRIAKGELAMEYTPTKEQLADIMSKGLMGHQFTVLQPRLHGDHTK